MSKPPRPDEEEEDVPSSGSESESESEEDEDTVGNCCNVFMQHVSFLYIGSNGKSK